VAPEQPEAGRALAEQRGRRGAPRRQRQRPRLDGVPSPFDPGDEVGERAATHGLRAADGREHVLPHREARRVGEPVARGNHGGGDRGVVRRVDRHGPELAPLRLADRHSAVLWSIT
jgi:hypothetical protein